MGDRDGDPWTDRGEATCPVTAFDKTEIIAGLNKSMSSNPVYAGQFVNISSQASAPFPVSVLT